MKLILSVFLGFFLSISSYCQVGEFEVYPNGLIYSEQTMNKLRHIVDSLNLKYKTCDFNTVFYSKYQTIGHSIRMDEGSLEEAVEDMKNDIPFEDFIKKYPTATVEQNILIIKDKYTNYKKKEIVEFEHFDLKSNYGLSINSEDLSLFDKKFANKWIYKYDKTLRAFYFPKEFESIAIPQKYSQMIGYSDCLIDTTANKFKENVKNGWVDLPENWTSLPQKEKAALLDKLRSINVIGGCSQDSSPREHAVNIAMLSAETYNWEVFLKAHLDVMNDRFERVSDGSYAWGERNTYIKELEELNINVLDLILGISFRMENPAVNHYFGSIGRVGRALSETQNRTEIENEILTIIKDEDLDYFNRLLFYFLFKNYNNYIEDESIKNENNKKLSMAIDSLPTHFRNELTEE